MSGFYRTILSATAMTAILASPALAGSVEVSDAVAHVEHDPEHGDTIEIFMNVRNSGDKLDRIYAVRSQIAKKGQISGGVDAHAAGEHKDHTLATTVNLPAGKTTKLHEEGSHLELADLTTEPKPGDVVPVTLFFENAGRIKLEIVIAEEGH